MERFKTAAKVDGPNLAAVVDSLAHDLAQVISEPIFDVAGLVEAALHQCFDPVLRGRSSDCSHARVPSGTELDLRRQAGIVRRKFPFDESVRPRS